LGKRAGVVSVIIFLICLFPVGQFFLPFPAPVTENPVLSPSSTLTSIESSIQPGETLSDIFRKHGLRVADLFAMRQAAASVHKLREVHPGQPYRFTVDKNNCVNSFTYCIDDNTVLKIERDENGFSAEKSDVPYESRILTLGGRIEDSLSQALGDTREDAALALSVSDILAWDIDFNTDLRRGDRFRIIVEGLYREGGFKKFGKILAVEFINDGSMHRAYLFERDGRPDYFDADGKSLKKAFLRAPLSFRRISSSFSKSRRHPILKINRPHYGIDYVAPQGTPVSATAEGRVSFAGFRAAYGRLVILTHANGVQTYYGHLSRLARGIHSGQKIEQGDLVGYVGATGLATGPHLHYEMRRDSRPMNPLDGRMTAGNPVLRARLDEYRRVTAAIDRTFADASFPETKDAKRLKYALSAVRTGEPGL
ncbi:hypothetical protein EG832_01500, partial [bacterium]|nr:hypothetical protein [bacterium]